MHDKLVIRHRNCKRGFFSFSHGQFFLIFYFETDEIFRFSNLDSPEWTGISTKCYQPTSCNLLKLTQPYYSLSFKYSRYLSGKGLPWRNGHGIWLEIWGSGVRIPAGLINPDTSGNLWPRVTTKMYKKMRTLKCLSWLNLLDTQKKIKGYLHNL